MSLLRFIFGVGILVILILIVREYRARRKIWEAEHAMEDINLELRKVGLEEDVAKKRVEIKNRRKKIRK